MGDSSHTLTIPAARKEDEGSYACVGTNPAGEVEERVQVSGIYGTVLYCTVV